MARDQNDIGSDQYTGLRLTALWQTTENLSSTLTYTHQEIEQQGFPEVNNNLSGDFQQIRLGTGVAGANQEFMGNEVDITNLLIEYDFGWGSLSSSSSWTEYDAINEGDLSFLFGGFLGPAYSRTESGNKVFVEEVRLTSQLNGPIQFLAGIYYEDNDAHVKGPWAWSGAIASDPFLGAPLFFVDNTTSTKQKALFGEISYQVTEKIGATFGLRAFDYDQDFDDFTADQHPNKSEDDSSYKLNLTYTPKSDTLIYGQWAEGFRLGQAKPSPSPLCDTNSDGLLDDVGFSAPDGIDSDTSESYEIGIKTSFVDRRFIVNASVYRINWEGMPVSITLPSCNSVVTLNAGEATSEGVELNLEAHLNENVKFDFNASYGEATLAEDAANLGNKGDNLPGSADFNLSTGVELSFNLFQYDAYARGDYSYISEYFHNISETGEASGGYSQINLKAGVSLDNLGLDLFVNNLTNANDFTWVETILGTVGANRAYRLRPRTIGINISYHF